MSIVCRTTEKRVLLRYYRRMITRRLAACVLLFLPALVCAGPPYVTDDPEPTDSRHYEIYLFGQGSGGRSGASSAYGIDFNYGAGDDLQLTAAVPFVFERPTGEASARGIGNIELAAKYRFAHKADIGWDIAVFPRLFLPSSSDAVGEKHFSLLIPVWFQHDWDDERWSTFGGGGCVINRGGDSKDFCLAGWAVTHQLSSKLQLGVELVHQSADVRGGHASTQAGFGAKYDINDTLHLLAYAGPSLQSIPQGERYAWYASVLITL
jgi:hypothetical protein